MENSLEKVNSAEMVVSHEEKIAAGEAEMAVIVVAGVTSGAGKTSLAEAVVKILSKQEEVCAAAKITVTHGERGCPHGGKGCDVCGSLGGEFQVITRESIIRQEGTDTGRLFEAGASQVLWTITREEFIGAAWRQMRSLMSGARVVVVESNTLALTIKPALTLMIVDPTRSRSLWKPSAERLIKCADLVIFNDRGTEEKRRSLLAEIERLRGSTRAIIFVSHPHEVEHQAALREALKEACLEITST